MQSSRFLSVGVIKNTLTKDSGRKGFISLYTSSSQCIIKGGQGRELEVGAWRQESHCCLYHPLAQLPFCFSLGWLPGDAAAHRRPGLSTSINNSNNPSKAYENVHKDNFIWAVPPLRLTQMILFVSN